MSTTIINLENLNEFIDQIIFKSSHTDITVKFIYRGEGSDKYLLLPSALRYTADLKLKKNYLKPLKNTESYQIRAEYSYLKEFCIEANRNGISVNGCTELIKYQYEDDCEEFDLDRFCDGKYEIWIPEFLLETASIAQHSGIPTRLLDWTNNAMCALYFACNDVLRILKSKPTTEDINQFLLNNDNKLSIWELNSSIVQRFNYDEIGKDTYGKIKLFVPQSQSHENIKAQKGVMMYRQIRKGNLLKKEIDRTPYDKLISEQFNSQLDPVLKKYTLPVSQIIRIYRFLDNCGINTASMYPSYDGVIRKLKEDSFIDSVSLL